MTDIDHWKCELATAVEEHAEQIANFQEAIDENDPQEEIEKEAKLCEAKLSRIREVKKSFGLELRLMTDKEGKKMYQKLQSDLDATVQSNIKKFNDLKSRSNKKELTGKPIQNQLPESIAGKTNDEVLAATHVIQDKTLESLARTQEMIEMSKEVGTSTIEQLRQQKDQIVDITEDVSVIASRLDEATRLVTTFASKIAGDRFIQCVFALNIVFLVIIIAFAASSS